ncbi:CHAT domain-containing protein [Kitasatospora sp. NPDC004669]|uniref:CHAT domain-containing protein n=1 Tax=Kitasatospora sp. NPDC004669 TaxID=3154555 RepID=UPI0033AB553B
MTRLVFHLAGAVDFSEVRYVVISLEEPSVFNSMTRPFQCTGREEPFVVLRQDVIPTDATKAAGVKLFTEVTRHPELAQYLPAALQTQPPQRYPVFVELATEAGVEALPWEALCSPSGEFLGLDERWAVGRIVDSQAIDRPLWDFKPPLRVAAVMSCLGVPAYDEWRALKNAVMSGPEVEVELLTVVSEPLLYTELSNLARDQRQSAQFPHLSVRMVPQELSELQEMVSRFGPHLLHFFCHGSTEGSPHIQLAVKSDWVSQSPANSLNIETREFKDFVGRTSDPPWLTVLNCCESAALGRSDNLHSLALGLVYQVGLPAVIGMREPIASTDASLFTGAFYKRLLTDFKARILRLPGSDEPIDWARFLVAARNSLAKKHKTMTLTQAASSTKEWTLPVVYMQRTPITFQIAPSQTRRARLEIEALQGFLAQLPPSTPLSLREDAESQLRLLVSQLEEQ